MVRNAKSALLAAIEIYNKPGFQYRDECFVILMLNAWELFLKALISKNTGSIYYPKERKKPHRTLSLADAFTRAQNYFPKNIEALPVGANLTHLGAYRDNAVHFYNEPGFGVMIYALGQTSIVNLKDLLKELFGIDLEEELTWQLMPLGLQHPVDPIQFISKNTGQSKKSSATKQFLTSLASSISSIEEAGADSGRLLTVFRIKLESIKKIEKADVVAGVAGKFAQGEHDGPLIIQKITDPNMSHPLRQKEVVKAIRTLNGKKFTSHTFQALCQKFGLKQDLKLCWMDSQGAITKYSHDIIGRIKTVSAADLEDALTSYKRYLTRRQATA